MIRPVDAEVNQHYGENPTSTIQPGSPDYWIIERFGNYQPDGHAGEDYAVEEGTPIRAVTSGTVVHVGYYGGSYIDNPYWIAPNFAGYCYVIDHGSFIGIYAHGKDKAARVAPGQYVDEGQIIGLTGNTGGSTGPHLHFEILPDRFVVNSYMYGRTNPETLFGSIAAQGTTTPEDDMGTVEAITDEAMQNLAAMVRGQVSEALADVTRSVAFQERFSVKMLEEIAAKTGVTVDSAAIAADIRKQLAAQLSK